MNSYIHVNLCYTYTMFMWSSRGGICHIKVESCTWWQVFEIWHGDRYGYKVSKNHRKQVGVSPLWPDREQSNMAATGTYKPHISANFTTGIKCNTTFYNVFRSGESIFAVSFGVIAIICKKNKIWWNIKWSQSIKFVRDTASCCKVF